MTGRAGGGIPGRDPVERFHGFVIVEKDVRPGVTTPCHRWGGALNSRGYGCFSFGGKGKTVLAARWACEYLADMDVPADRVVAHRCNFPACVNLDHLELRDGPTHRRLGRSPCAVNARKTECINGHPLSGLNLFLEKDGHRQCRICSRRVKPRRPQQPIADLAPTSNAAGAGMRSPRAEVGKTGDYTEAGEAEGPRAAKPGAGFEARETREAGRGMGQSPIVTSPIMKESLADARMIARTFGPKTGLDYDDAYSAALEALVEATRRFDPKYGRTFGSWAAMKMKCAVIDAARSWGWVPRRVARRLRDQGLAVSPVERLEEDRIPGTCDTPEVSLARAEIGAWVRTAVARLPARERRMIEGTYLEGAAHRDVARTMGLSPGWASRLHTKALDRLRVKLRKVA